MVIKCATEADAIQVIRLQDLVKDMQNKTAMEIALVFHHGFDDEQISVTGPFYSVCISSHPAIYIDWYVLNLCFVCLLNHVPCRNEAASTLAGWTYPRWARHDTLKAAIIFMIMKGKNSPKCDRRRHTYAESHQTSYAAGLESSDSSEARKIYRSVQR